MDWGLSFQVMASCKHGFYCHCCVFSSPKQMFYFGTGSIKDLRNVDVTAHMFMVSICNLGTCLHCTMKKV